MAGDMPGDFGEGSTSHPPIAGQWAPAYPTQPAPRSRTWPAIALAAVATAVAVAALVVALTNSTRAAPPPTTTVPSFSAAETAAAQRQLCDTYKLQARTVRVDTNGNDEALARIAATNGAVMLYNAAANPALDSKHRDAARALATAYGNVSAMGSKGVATDAEWRAVLDDANAKDAAMSEVCGGG
jgi:hypothetical protein